MLQTGSCVSVRLAYKSGVVKNWLKDGVGASNLQKDNHVKQHYKDYNDG